MPPKIILFSFLIVTSFTLYATTLSDELRMLESLEAQEIAEASANPQSKSLEKLDDTKLHAVLGVVTSFIVTDNEVVDQPTVFNVESNPGTDPFTGNTIVTPTGDITSLDQQIEYIEVNGVKVDVNAMSYTFSGTKDYNGGTLNIFVKLKGLDKTDDYSA